MKRKIVYFLVAILLFGAICTLLTACNTDNDDGGDSITLMVYQPENNKAKTAYETMIKEFTKESGVNVRIKFVPKDDYNTKLKTNFKTTKNKPDVFYLDQPMLADYAHLCLNLNTGFFADEGEEGLHTSDFFDVAIDTVKYNGDILAVPFSLTTSILLYNTTLTSVPKSWDEWRNISVPDGKALFGGIGSGGYASWYFQAFLKSAGGDMISADNEIIFNNAQGVAAAQMVRDLYSKSPKGIRESSNSFTNGNVMFTLAHNADIFNAYTNNPSFFENNLGATLFIPQTEGGTSYSNIGGENFAISKDSKNIDACKQLVKFLLREENVDKAISTNFSAIKKYAKVRETNPNTGEVYSEKFKQVMGVVLQQLNYASARPQVKNWMKVNDDYLSTALSEILDDTSNSIQDCLDRAQKQATNTLEFD